MNLLQNVGFDTIAVNHSYIMYFNEAESCSLRKQSSGPVFVYILNDEKKIPGSDRN